MPHENDVSQTGAASKKPHLLIHESRGVFENNICEKINGFMIGVESAFSKFE